MTYAQNAVAAAYAGRWAEALDVLTQGAEAGDVANAINSLMGGERFEVSVVRKDEPVQLNYVVR